MSQRCTNWLLIEAILQWFLPRWLSLSQVVKTSQHTGFKSCYSSSSAVWHGRKLPCRLLWNTLMTSDISYCTWSVCLGYREHFWKNSKVCKSYIVALRLLRIVLQYFSFCLYTAKHWYLEPIPISCLCFLSKKAYFETQSSVRESCLEIKVGIQHSVSSLLRTNTS